MHQTATIHEKGGVICDTQAGYSLISRALHWLMALLFAWQFTSALLHFFADDTAVKAFFWATHASVGFTLYLLSLVRGAWALANWRRRPTHSGSPLERAASMGHLALYSLMIIVPLLAILRAIGNGRGMRVYGLELIAPGGEPNLLLTTPANVAHGVLGWTSLVLTVGHVGMVLLHSVVWRDATLDRMTKGWSVAPASSTLKEPM
ncbi:cytochrome b [Xanthobacter sp. VTT E-85241]|uniref:cytochrome b n=1 Tax=Roseixanthobacter finlandensis TaxID=3119922 RepID=UPI003729B4FE